MLNFHKMVILRSKDEIYDWFQQIQGWSRMDFVCNIIHLCNPFELRFLGACIEDMAQTDYNALRDREVKANSAENLDQFISKNPPVDKFLCHILVCLALLQSSNYKVASKLADLLNDELERLNLEHVMQAGLDAEVEQWMLMLTLAVYHPAFSFERKRNFKKKLCEYERMSEIDRKSMSWCRRNHRYSQLQHTTEDCDDAGWNADINPEPVPFQHYSARPEWGYNYMDYNPDPYQRKYSHGNVPDGVMRPPNMRSSTFSGPMPQANIAENPIGAKYSHNTDYVGYNIESPRDERTILHFKGDPQALPRSVQNSFNNASSFPNATEYFPAQRSSTIQTTVSQAPTVSNVTSVRSTGVTTTAMTQTMSPSPLSGGECLSRGGAGGGYRTTGTNPRQFITVPKSDCAKHEQSSNRIPSEIQRLKNRHRSQSGDTNFGRQKWQKSDEKAQNPVLLKHQLRPSTSAPMLTWNKEEQNTNSLSFKEETGKKQNLGNKEEASPPNFKTKNLKPINVSVNIIPKNKKEGSKLKGETRFALQVEWSDKTTSECYRSVEEIVTFYKQVTGKIGNIAIDTDFLTKQNNQVVERRKKLEGIFSEVVSSMVSDSNLEQFMAFLRYKPPSLLPPKKRKYKPGCKSRAVFDGSGSSSSTASPPLVNNTNSRLISPQISRPESSLSPLSTKESICSSSVLSSPSSATTITLSANDEKVHYDHDSDSSNDPYMKLYYWLQERNLGEHYEHLREYEFDEFCKLQPSDINSFGFLSTEEKTIFKQEIAKMRKGALFAKEDDMGTLSTSSEVKDEGPKAIKTISDDVVRTQSEEEKTGSVQSAPVAFQTTNDDIQATSSRSCFSFEFDLSSAAVDSTTSHSLSNNPKNDDDLDTMTRLENIGYFQPGNSRLSDPGRAWSQTEVGPITYPVASVYMPRSAPPLPQMTSGHVAMGCHIPSCAAPISASTSISAGGLPTSAQPAIMTLPSLMLPPLGQKQTQYVYTVTSTSPGTMYPLVTSFYPIQSITSPLGDKASMSSPAVYVNTITPPIPEGGDLCLSNLDSNERVSPASSDPDSSSKPQEVSLPQNTSYGPVDSVVSNRRGAGPTHCYYNPAPRFPYTMPPWGPPTYRPLFAPGYSDPTFFPPKQHANDFYEYPACPVPSGSFTWNSYGNPVMGRNRGMPHNRHYSGDSAPRRTDIISCYNCGRRGHDASSCREPNTVDLLGTDFHLKMSQSNNRRVND